MASQTAFHIRVVETIDNNELSSERWPCPIPESFYAWGVYTRRAEELIHCSDHSTLAEAARACARARAREFARALVKRACRSTTVQPGNDYPAYPCDHDPDGMHHIGCGCSFDD